MACCAPPAACSGVSAAMGCSPLVPQDGALAAVLTVAVHFLQQVLPVHAGTGSYDDLVDQSHVSNHSPRRRKKPQRVVHWVELSVIPVWTRRLPCCVIPPPKQQSSSGHTGLIPTDCLNIWDGLWHRPGILWVQPQLPLSPLGASGWEPLLFDPVHDHQLSLGSMVPWSPPCVKVATHWCCPLSLWLCGMEWGLGCGY